MTGQDVYRAFGYRFGVQVFGVERDFLPGAIEWTLQGLRQRPDDKPGHLYRFEATRTNMVRLESDDLTLTEESSEWVALSVMLTDLNRQAVASRPDQLNLHAGAVSKGGKGVLLPADSGSGKTTLTAALVTAGCDYLTDEAASIDLTTLMVEPYPKPLSLSPSSLQALGCPPSEHGPMELIPASWLRPDPWGEPVRPGSIVFPRFQGGAGTELTPISRGEALVELANNSFNFVDHGGPWLPVLRDLVAGCECWRITFGNALEAAERIMGLTA